MNRFLSSTNSYTNQHKRSDVYDPENNSIIFGILLTFIFRKSHLKSFIFTHDLERDLNFPFLICLLFHRDFLKRIYVYLGFNLMDGLNIC